MRSALVVLAVVLAPRALAAPQPAAIATPAAPAADGARIQVAFKLDPRLSGPTYGGERWVAPPVFRGVSAQREVEARASIVDARGRPIKGSPRWKAADPELVSVTPSRGDRVTIAARRGGESHVTVALGGTARTLTVKATLSGGAWQLIISQ